MADSTPPTKRIFRLEEAVQKIAQLRSENPAIKIGFANGTFSIPHQGHYILIEQARQKCDFLVVALNSHTSIAALNRDHGKVINDEARKVLIAISSPADAIITFDETDAVNLIKTLKPDILFKGDEKHVKRKKFPEALAIEALGGSVELLPTHEKDRYSASKLAKKPPANTPPPWERY